VGQAKLGFVIEEGVAFGHPTAGRTARHQEALRLALVGELAADLQPPQAFLAAAVVRFLVDDDHCSIWWALIGPDRDRVHAVMQSRRQINAEGGIAVKMPPVVSPVEWEAARQELLVKEKELTRARDALAAERRRMPRMEVEKEYRFEGPDGPTSLLDMFDGRRQLVVYRFFFEPGVRGWPERGCGGCSFLADQVAHLAHLNARDTTLAFVSRAPQPDIERWKARMGWEIPWYTIVDDFDADFGVDEWHGTNAFFREGDRIFRTYFVNNRGDESMGSTWSFLDLTALGRQEEWEDSPEGYPQSPPYQWWNLHDEYDKAA
jgi:predicted dithiol-disulfide oxidoreductase (DUF899 family)